jgi:hypothetical protein
VGGAAEYADAIGMWWAVYLCGERDLMGVTIPISEGGVVRRMIGGKAAQWGNKRWGNLARHIAVRGRRRV